mmetsp:Transcript_49039/g.140952  ORF Transcript_49039/g.140952 Transcript_49039/m.140952 type:complete len:259 (+) Transcript_49039:69-845(+)
MAPAEISSKPKDGPATSFYADPLVTSIYGRESDFIDLVLVAGFPLLKQPQHIEAYQSFLQLVKTCLDPKDLKGLQPTAFLYDVPYLHVTIATLYPLQKRSSSSETVYTSIQNYFLKLLQVASDLPDWPKQALQLEIDSTQLGAKAGILLWKELSGGLAAMRECLRVAEDTLIQKDEAPWKIHSIPGIIHTTFIRFSKEPETNGEALQASYQSKVIPAISSIFSEPVEVSEIHLVCETTPYMHMIKEEGRTVLKTMKVG